LAIRTTPQSLFISGVKIWLADHAFVAGLAPCQWRAPQVQPRLMLVLFAALMAFDQQKRRQQQQQQHVQAEVSARQRQQGQA
jgi:hypothetical protein